MPDYLVRWKLTGTSKITAASAEEAEIIAHSHSFSDYAKCPLDISPTGETIVDSFAATAERVQLSLQPLLLVTPKKTYRGAEALQEIERRQPTLRHADPSQSGGEAC